VNGKPREPLDFVAIHRELRRKAVTLMLLWQEYKAAEPEATSTANFATSTTSGRDKSIRSCAWSTGLGRPCLSTGPG